jgi:hypothetical protein
MGEDFNIHVFQRLQGHPPIAMTCPQSAAGILPADLTLPESGAMPKGFHNFRAADRIIIQFDLPAGWSEAGLAWKHFVARPQCMFRHKGNTLSQARWLHVPFKLL